MIVMLVLGAGCGFGLLLMYRALTAKPRLSDVGAALALPGRSAFAEGVSSRSVIEKRLVIRTIDVLRAIGMDPNMRAADLRVSRRTVDQHVIAKLTGGFGFGVLAGLGSFVIGFTPLLALTTALVLGGCGFFLPELTLSGEAKEGRTAFRHAFSGYLDLVNVMLAAGAGPEGALHTAANSGSGWVFAELRSTLETARRTRLSMGDAFTVLGDELDISDLRELGATISLVGNQGAKIRQTLAAKADTMRAQQVSEAEAASESATERMTLPVVVLLIGFLVFLAYPAVVKITEVGSP